MLRIKIAVVLILVLHLAACAGSGGDFEEFAAVGRAAADAASGGQTFNEAHNEQSDGGLRREFLLFGGPGHDEFLGCLGCSSFDSDSVCNRYGKGNRYASNSIFNAFGTYGNRFNTSSPWNRYSTNKSVPVLVDRSGNFYGYLTINTYRSDAVGFAGGLQSLFEHADGDLEIIRKALCEAF